MTMRFLVVTMLALVLSSCDHKTEQASMETQGAVTVREVTVTEEAPAAQAAAASQAQPPAGVQVDVTKPTTSEIQQALKNANFYDGNIDGVIGPKTKKAIESFQMQNELKADGIVGPKTWEKLKKYL